MPRIFKYGDIPNTSFTPDKELNILIYRSPIQKSYTLKYGPVFWPTLYNKLIPLWLSLKKNANRLEHARETDQPCAVAAGSTEVLLSGGGFKLVSFRQWRKTLRRFTSSNSDDNVSTMSAVLVTFCNHQYRTWKIRKPTHWRAGWHSGAVISLVYSFIIKIVHKVHKTKQKKVRSMYTIIIIIHFIHS